MEREREREREREKERERERKREKDDVNKCLQTKVFCSLNVLCQLPLLLCTNTYEVEKLKEKMTSSLDMR